MENIKGKLKIFFGYAAGVGKTYAMLEAAHQAQETGVDVVAGYIEPHARPETLALLDGLPQIEPKTIEHKGIKIKEFDIDETIRRKPELVLVDELAHSNAPSSRNVKRYQDVEELLNMGIDVYTTINVQHIESLNDIVENITGVVVNERIPDSVFDSADKVELVDIEPDELIERLNEGKIYKKNQAERALENFFTKENLVALREIALRRTADAIAAKDKVFANKNIHVTEEHILLCLSSSPSNAKVIRTAARMADAFHGTLTALFVETSEFENMGEKNKQRLRENIKLAEQLGAKIATVYGNDIPYLVAEYAKISGVSKIVVGRSGSRGIWRRKFVDKLTNFAPNLEVYVIPDKKENFEEQRKKKFKLPKVSMADSLKSLAILLVATIVGFVFSNLGFDEANIVTIYILSVLFIAYVTSGQIYGLTSSLLAVLLFSFCFIEPKFSVAAYNSKYVFTFVVMFLAAFLTSTLTKRVKQQLRLSSMKAYRTEVLLETSQTLQRAKNKDELIKISAEQIGKLLKRTVIFYPVDGDDLGEPCVTSNSDLSEYLSPDERAVAQWVLKNNKHAGATTNTLPGAKCLYMAIRNEDKVLGVVAIVMEKDEKLDAFEKNILITVLGECALAIEKENILETKNEIALKAKQEQLRANLLRAISHDLRTPLTSILGNADILISSTNVLNDEKKSELYEDIYDDSMWLINLVENLLAITQIDDGGIGIKMEPELVEEVVKEALSHISSKKVEHNIKLEIADDMIMAKMDARLIIQVIINIVDNAIKYTPQNSNIIIGAKKKDEFIEIEIADDGEGISNDAKRKLFDMFFTAENTVSDSRRGLGLGLSLCKSIINAHGGEIAVRDNIPKGTVISFTLLAS